MTTIEFVIPGEPIGKPRMTQRDKWKKRTVVLRYHAWRDGAVAAMLAAGVAQDEPPDEIAVDAWISMPRSWSVAKRDAAMARSLAYGKPDVDNILKAVLDCFGEDKDVGRALITKRWCENQPRIEVRLFYR